MRVVDDRIKNADVSDGPMAGIRVLELGTLLAGPFVGRLLGDFGAEVIHTEAPGEGDPLREWGQVRYRGRALWWPVQSRNKKSISLNLRDPRGQELCRRLLAKCDVLVENFRPGTLERWGLGPDRLFEVNSDLIIARVSGYGQTGPYSSRPGFASAGEAIGGLRYINGFPGEAPPRCGISLGDSLAAMFAAQGVLMALYHRDVRGARGQVIDASIAESCFALLESIVPEYGAIGHVREPSGTHLKHVPASNVYRSRDGRWIVIAANAASLWKRLCVAMGRDDLIDDPRFASHARRIEHSDLIDAIIGAWVAERDAAEVDRILNEAEVVCGAVNSIADIFADPHFREREMLLDMVDPELGHLTAPGVVPKLSDTPGKARFTGRGKVGEDNEEIYSRLLGKDPEEIAQLAAEGVI